jgi:arylsulfatase A-like enzyme
MNGHPLLRTPALDRMAAEGMNYTHAFCPIPLCVPVRNSLLNGQWPTEHLCIANYDTEAPRPPGDGLPTFSQLLRDAGYWLGYVGKWHVHRRADPLAYGFNAYVPEGEYGAYRAKTGLPPLPRRNRWFGELDPHVGPEGSRLGWGADQTIRMLEACAATGQAFFIRWDPSEPHLPNVVPEPYYSMYPPDTIPPWPSIPDPLTGKPYIQAQQRRTWQLDQWTWQQWAPIVSRYLGEISLMDAQIGRLLDAVDRLGLAADTWVIYTTDHGDLCGGHGMIDKHFVMYDDVVRVPLTMRWPGQISPGSTCDAFVAHAIDLATTFCEVAGVPVPETFRGSSLLPLMRGTGDNGRSDIFATYHGNQFGLYSQRMVRDRRWKYVWNATAEDELYDLEADPAEVTNLAVDPRHTAELKRLRRRLVEWMEQTRDPLLNQWTRTQLLEGLKV